MRRRVHNGLALGAVRLEANYYTMSLTAQTGTIPKLT